MKENHQVHLAQACPSARAGERSGTREPMDAWVAYAKRSGLLDENGVATDRAKAQTAWFAFTAAWNEARTATPEQPVPASEAQPNGLDPAVSCWCQPEGPPHSKACPMHESRKTVSVVEVRRTEYTPGGLPITVVEEKPARGVKASQPRKATNAEIAEWAERHDLRGSATDLRAAFEDAASLHLTFVEQSSESRTNAHLAAPRDAARADQGAAVGSDLAAVRVAITPGAAEAVARGVTEVPRG